MDFQTRALVIFGGMVVFAACAYAFMVLMGKAHDMTYDGRLVKSLSAKRMVHIKAETITAYARPRTFIERMAEQPLLNFTRVLVYAITSPVLIFVTYQTVRTEPSVAKNIDNILITAILVLVFGYINIRFLFKPDYLITNVEADNQNAIRQFVDEKNVG